MCCIVTTSNLVSKAKQMYKNCFLSISFLFINEYFVLRTQIMKMRKHWRIQNIKTELENAGSRLEVRGLSREMMPLRPSTREYWGPPLRQPWFIITFGGGLTFRAVCHGWAPLKGHQNETETLKSVYILMLVFDYSQKIIHVHTCKHTQACMSTV